MLLEVCVDSVEQGLVAAACGAQRIELNCALAVGGLTPSLAAVEQLCEKVQVPIIAMLRPRPGGFCFSPAELTQMQRDAELLLKAGASGIAFGCLTPQLQVDPTAVKNLVEVAGSAETVFHRAIDWTTSLPDALSLLIELGVTRVLTSGGEKTAWSGRAMIKQLIQQADGRIEVLPASGIRSTNVCELIKETSCNQIHGSFSDWVPELGRPSADRRASGISFVSEVPLQELLQARVDTNELDAALSLLREL